MRAPADPPRRAEPRRARWLAAGLAGSAAVHAAAIAAILFWPGGTLPEAAGEGGGVALVFADTAALAGGAPASGAPPAVPPAAPDAPVPPDPPAAAPPSAASDPADAPAPPVPEPPRDVTALAIPAPEDPLPPPPPPAPRPPEPAAAPPRQEDAAPRPAARPAPRAAPGPVRLDAGMGALPDPSLGARATGAVAPPAAAEGHRNAPPEYPPDSRRRGEEGVVRLTLSIAADGNVTAAEIAASSGHAALDRAAVAAARRWRFRPATQAGLPVAATLGTAVHFRLRDR